MHSLHCDLHAQEAYRSEQACGQVDREELPSALTVPYVPDQSQDLSEHCSTLQGAF